MKVEETPYGFKWGAASFERWISDDPNGWIVAGIQTPKATVQVYVTRTGHIRLSARGTCVRFQQAKVKRGRPAKERP